MKWFAAFAIVLLFSAASFTLSRIPVDSYAAVLASVLVDYTNDNRSSQGLGQLATSSVLEVAAQNKANDMAEKGYFAHYSPGGQTPWTWLDEAGYKFEFAGENLAVNFVNSRDVSKAWMNSPTHKANIVNPRFTEIGIATARGTYKGKDTVFVVQMFGTPRDAQLAATTTPPNGAAAAVFGVLHALRAMALAVIELGI